jgi:hypothetical protein
MDERGGEPERVSMFSRVLKKEKKLTQERVRVVLVLAPTSQQLVCARHPAFLQSHQRISHAGVTLV